MEHQTVTITAGNVNTYNNTVNSSANSSVNNSNTQPQTAASIPTQTNYQNLSQSPIIQEHSSIYVKVLDKEQFLPESQTIIKEFICSLCLGVYYNPVTDPCGHVFCNHCLSTYFKYNKTNCPTTGKPYLINDISKLSQPAPSYFTQIIGKQKLRCIKKDCEWVNDLSKLYDHIRNECIYVIIKCPYKENGCKFSSTRSEVKSHETSCNFRIYECELCKEKGFYFQRDEHKSNCKKEKIECPQKCSVDLERDDVDNHILNYCENTTVNCEFNFFGCKETLSRKNLASHNLSARKSHIRIIHQAQENLTEQVKALSARIKECSDLKKKIIQAKPLGSQYYYENIYKFRDFDFAIIKEIEALHSQLAENIKYNRKRKEKLKLISDEEIEEYVENELNDEEYKIHSEEMSYLKRKRGSEKTDDEELMSVKF